MNDSEKHAIMDYQSLIFWFIAFILAVISFYYLTPDRSCIGVP